MRAVRHRMLGEVSVPAVGLGDVSLARAAMRGVDAVAVERVVHEAIAAGLAVIEVASDTEALVGAVVRAERARDRAIVVVEVPALAEKPGRPRDLLPERLPPRYVQDHVEASLRATRLD